MSNADGAEDVFKQLQQADPTQTAGLCPLGTLRRKSEINSRGQGTRG